MKTRENITKEALFKYGFVDYKHLFDTYKLNKFIITKNIYDSWSVQLGLKSLIIRYIDELETTYFDLTGKRLKLK